MKLLQLSDCLIVDVEKISVIETDPFTKIVTLRFGYYPVALNQEEAAAFANWVGGKMAEQESMFKFIQKNSNQFDVTELLKK